MEIKQRSMKTDGEAIFSVYNAAVMTKTKDAKVRVYHSHNDTRTQS
jgi:hypothetical protein